MNVGDSFSNWKEQSNKIAACVTSEDDSLAMPMH